MAATISEPKRSYAGLGKLCPTLCSRSPGLCWELVVIFCFGAKPCYSRSHPYYSKAAFLWDRRFEISAKRVNNQIPKNDRPIHFEWWRFAIVAVLIIGTIAVVTWFKTGPGTSVGIILAMAILAASLVGYFAFRWHKLRVAAATGVLTTRDFYADPRSHILGPKKPLVIWFICTIAAILGTVVLFALRAV
jgi:hypothetical protein